jgi:hypothetical protein
MNWFVYAGKYLAFGIVTVLMAFMGSPPAGVSAAATASVVISEVHPSGSGNGTYAADWFEVTNTGTSAVDITGWKMDDNSNSPAAAVVLNGVASIAPGQSVVFIESSTPGPTIPLCYSYIVSRGELLYTTCDSRLRQECHRGLKCGYLKVP